MYIHENNELLYLHAYRGAKNLLQHTLSLQIVDNNYNILQCRPPLTWYLIHIKYLRIWILSSRTLLNLQKLQLQHGAIIEI